MTNRENKNFIAGMVALVVIGLGVVAIVNVPHGHDYGAGEHESQVHAEDEHEVFEYQGIEGQTALEVLRDNYSVETREFTGVGEFVTSINGVAADDRHFWSFYVNGEMAQVGAGEYETRDGDKIEWKLEEIK